jgi:hypothetical protein
MCDEPRVYTGLWWNPQESGWGLNTTHQGNILFATLFTYAADGQPLWLVASSLAGIGENTYTGPLYRTHGPPFNQLPWSPIGFDQVGMMTIAWDTPETAMVSYTFNGTPVTKRVQRQVFGSSVPTCVVVAGSRAAETNYQDLWWNPAESGWGINLVHQGTIIFATLFSYSEAGRDKWFVASNLARQADGSFTGDLYATNGTGVQRGAVDLDRVRARGIDDAALQQRRERDALVQRGRGERDQGDHAAGVRGVHLGLPLRGQRKRAAGAALCSLDPGSSPRLRRPG